MHSPDFKLMESLDELLVEIPKIKNKWKNLKKNKTFLFTEYTDDRINLLSRIIARKDLKNEVKLRECNGIIGELDVIHFKGRINLNWILNFSDTSHKIWYFVKYNHLLDDKKFWRRLRNAYTSQDYNPVPYPILLSLFTSNRDEEKYIMNKKERDYLDALPESFVIYRAMSKKEFNSKKFRFSWTLNKKIAEKFAKRSQDLYSTEMIIHELTINKEDVFAYLNVRKEEEIIYFKK